MGRRLGPYAPLSATYAADDAMIQAGEAAELLFCRGLAFCATSNSDGYISDAQLVRLVGVGMKDAAKRAAKLVTVGLWMREEGGYIVRSWLQWNASAEELGKQRARDRDRKAQRNPPPIPDGIQMESGGKPSGIQAESNGHPDGFHPRAPAHEARARPNHSTTQNGTERKPPADATASAGKLIAEYIDGCNRRPPDTVVGQLAKHVGKLLAEDFKPEHIREGLSRFRSKGDLHPSVLPSIVNGIANPPESESAPKARTEAARKFG